MLFEKEITKIEKVATEVKLPYNAPRTKHFLPHQ
jgi:hypothetical protein